VFEEKNGYNKFTILQVVLMVKNMLYKVKDKALRRFLKSTIVDLLMPSVRYIIDYDLDKKGLNKLAFYLEEEFYFEEKRCAKQEL